MQIALDSITRPTPLTPREGIPVKRASPRSPRSSRPAPKAKVAEAIATSSKMEEEKVRRERASAALKGAVKPMLAEEIAARATNKLTTIFVPSIIKMHPKECYNLLRDIQITRGKLRVVKFTSNTNGCELFVQQDKEMEVRRLLEAAGLQPAPKGKGWNERILKNSKIEIISKEVKEIEMFLKILAPECANVREYLAERLVLLHQKVTALEECPWRQPQCVIKRGHTTFEGSEPPTLTLRVTNLDAPSHQP